MAFDDRLIIVSFEIDGKLKKFSNIDSPKKPLYIKATGMKYANQVENEAEVKIANLSAQDRNYIITNTSPFNKNNKRKKLIIEAGRVSTGTSIVYSGDIVSANPSQPPDVILTVKAKTGNFLKGKKVSKTRKSHTSLEEISKEVATDLECSLQYEADSKQIGSASYCGSATEQVRQLQDTGGVNAYIDNDKLVVKNYNVPLLNTLRILNENTGMVGIPEINEEGVKIKFMYDTKTKLGGGLQIESVLNPVANGTYVIYQLGFDICTRETSFYYISSCKRLNK